MRFSLLAMLPVVALLATFGRAEDSCDDGPDLAPFAPGRVGGQAFPDPADYQMTCESRWRGGDQIVGIEAWSAKFQIKAVRFKFFNSGWTQAHGDIPDDGAYSTSLAEWAPGEEVAVHITNNKPDDGNPMDGVGRIRITKGSQEIFNVGCAANKMQPVEIEGIDNGAGIILGAKVRSGAWVSSLEFKMLKSKIVKTQLMEINIIENLADWNSDSKGIQNVSIGDTAFINPNEKGGANLTWTFANTISKTATKSVTDEYSNTFGVGIDLKFSNSLSVPGTVKFQWEAGISAKYEHQQLHSDTGSWSDTVSMTYSLGGIFNSPLLPQRAAVCEAWAISGTFDSRYNGVVQSILADGSKYNFYSSGAVHSVGWVQSRVQCKDMDLKDVPPDANITNGDPIPESPKRAVVFLG